MKIKQMEIVKNYDKSNSNKQKLTLNKILNNKFFIQRFLY